MITGLSLRYKMIGGLHFAARVPTPVARYYAKQFRTSLGNEMCL